MNSNNSKFPYILAGSAIGGAIGYFVMTDSGRRFLRSARNMDSHGLRSQLEGTRECVERAGQTVTDRVHDVLDRAKQSIEVGRQAYADSEMELRTQPTWLKGKSDRVASSIHETVDGLNETVSSVESSVREPFYELAALAKAFSRGAKRFFQQELPTVSEPSVNTGQNAQTPNFSERFG
jgi:hypothetical protein